MGKKSEGVNMELYFHVRNGQAAHRVLLSLSFPLTTNTGMTWLWSSTTCGESKFFELRSVFYI